MKRCLVVLDDLAEFGSEARHRRTARGCTAVRLRKEEHVVDDDREAPQILQVLRDHVLQFGHRSLALQGQLARTDQGGQRRSKFVRNVGVEAFQLRVSAFDTHQQRVEAVDQWPEFERLSRSVQPQPCPSQSDRVHLCGQFLHRQKASADQQEPRHADDARTDE